MTEAILQPEEVQQQLEEKDHLIQALTDRLSEAAEQLDRKQRSGTGLGGRSAGASGEMLEQQRLLLDNLSLTIEQWEDVQPRDAFGRIEARLDHLRNLLESAVGSGLAPSEITPSEALSRTPSETPSRSKPKQQQQAEPHSEADTKQEMLSGWEAMKAQLLAGSGGPADEPETADPPTADNTPAEPPSPDGNPPSDTAEESPAAPAGDDVELPEPVDFDTAERNDLEQAIDVRDIYIGYLTRRLRREQQRTRETIDWEALNNAPEQLQETLRTLESDLEERLRIAEVDLSLERARLSRVQSQTEEMQRQVEARMKFNKQKRSKEIQDNQTSSEGDPGSSKSWFNNLRRK